jgi:hypothetical protein
MLIEIQRQLSRLHSRRMVVTEVSQDPRPYRVKVTVGAQSCVVPASGLLEMLIKLPDSVRTRGIVAAIRQSVALGEAWAQ